METDILLSSLVGCRLSPMPIVFRFSLLVLLYAVYRVPGFHRIAKQ